MAAKGKIIHFEWCKNEKMMAAEIYLGKQLFSSSSYFLLSSLILKAPESDWGLFVIDEILL